MQFTLHIDCTTAFYIYIYTYIWEDGEREHRRGYFYMYIASCTGLDRKCHQIFVAIFRLEQVSCWLFDAWRTLWKNVACVYSISFFVFYIQKWVQLEEVARKIVSMDAQEKCMYVVVDFFKWLWFLLRGGMLNAWFDWKKKYIINNFQSILIKSSL